MPAPTRSTASKSGGPPANQRPIFRLVRYFTAASLLAFVIIATALGYLVHELSVIGLREEYEHDNVNFAAMLSNELWGNDLAPLLRAMEGRPPAEFKGAPQIPELHRKVLALAKGTTIFKVKVYDLTGTTVYSSELEQIGEDKSRNGGVIAALRGETKSELVHKGTFSALEGEVQNRALVQSYIPQYDPASGKVAGVFEVYTDATRYLAQLREKQWYIVGAVIGLLGLLYLALFLIVNVAQKIISRQGEEHFRSLVEQSITGIYVLQDGKLAYANPRFAELLGYSADRLTGVNPDFFVAAEDLPQAQANMRTLLEGRQRSVASSFGARRNGGTIVELGVHMARALFKGKAAVIVLAQDITERKRAQDRIAAYVKQLESSMLGTVRAVSSIVEMRDPYTAGHERRVGGIARAIGAELGLPEDRCKGLEVIGLVHDIGKMATPAEILSKPGRLLPTELALIKGHAQAGYDIMKEVESPWPLAQAILQHHERLDGSGYPHGLKGEEILLEARILAVADVVEAMATHRPYRPSLGIAAALEEIAKNSGKSYDPQVARACLTLFRDKGYELPA